MRRPRRGFALAMVMMVALIVSVCATILLERQAASRLALKAQLDSYQEHHTREGLREMLEMWTMMFRRSPDHPKDAEIGFDLTSDLGTLKLRLTDGQGTLRRASIADEQTSNLPLWVTNIAAQTIRQTQKDPGPFLREMGSPKVSLNTAPPEVLSAMVTAIDPDGTGGIFGATVAAKRADHRLTAEEMPQVLVASITGLSASERSALNQMLVVEPTLWRADATLTSPTGEVLGTEHGLVEGELRPATNATLTTSSWHVYEWVKNNPSMAMTNASLAGLAGTNGTSGTSGTSGAGAATGSAGTGRP